MKRLLLTLSMALSFTAIQAQFILVENFDTVPGVGWTRTNQSTPAGPSNWGQGVITQFDAGAFSGEPTAFAMVNSASAIGNGTISNWLMSPVISLQNDDIIRFFSRVGLPSGQTAVVYPDRLEMRISTNGAATTVPSGVDGVGDYTTLALTINENLTTTGYPTSWNLYEYTVSGLSGPTDCKIAFRYYVTNGGTQGTNSNIIGLDLLSVERTLGTNVFFKSNFAVYPNPATDLVKIENKNGIVIDSIAISDANGSIVKRFEGRNISGQINISELNSGVYFLKIHSDQGTETTKIIKN